MGRLGETFRRIGCVGVSAFAKRRQLRRDLLVIAAVSKSSLTSPDADTPIRRPADTLPLCSGGQKLELSLTKGVGSFSCIFVNS
jgi:hypothetical protein